jgi:ribosome recycling factor
MDNVSEFKQNSQKTIDFLKEDLKSIRTGHASASLIENIIVETYEGTAKLRLLELSTISTEGPATLVIVPFDSSVTQDIEKAILKSPLGLSPAVQGNRIIIRIPGLSTEQREKYIKIVGEKIEEKKVQIRNHRDDSRKILKTKFENKEITEDEKFRLEKEIDEETSKFMDQINLIKENKIIEITAV